MDKRNSFIMYLDYKQHFALISNEDLGKLTRSLFDYVENDIIPDFKDNTALQMAFSFIQTNIDIDNRKYQEKCEKNKQIAEERWKRQKQKFKGCHLGSVYKTEACFRCQKKNICTLPVSPDFISKNGKSFKKWNKKMESFYESWCAERKSQGKSTDIELFDYNWLED